jgi:tRNA (mo5U34)-methyltransferase
LGVRKLLIVPPEKVAQRGGRAGEPDALARVRGRLEDIGWYHTQELGPGLVTPGMFDLRPFVRHYGLPDDLSGKRALDVGTFEGFWAFELERRGAEVTAIDVDSIQDLDWPPRLRPATDDRRGEGFELAKAALGSSVERVGVSVYDATPEALGGRFDLVFCGSVLIHLRDPMLALERMAALCGGRLVLAEEYSRKLELLPFLNAAEFRGESPWSTWWRPSTRAWLAMVRTAGFEDARRHSRFNMRFREMRNTVPHVVIHARGPAG